MRESQGIATRTNERKAQNPTQKNEVKIKPLRFTMMIQVKQAPKNWSSKASFHQVPAVRFPGK